jgi:hypothetical protein
MIAGARKSGALTAVWSHKGWQLNI